MENKFLSYGSVISISHVFDDHSFITADGFVKRNVLLKNFHHIDLLAKEDVKSAKNKAFLNTLFQIFPKFTNNVKQEIVKDLSPEEEDEEAGPGINSILDNLKAVKSEETQPLTKEQIQQYSQKLLQEFKYNLDTFEKAKTLKVPYKAPIQLLHLASSKFLACHQKEARFESQNYKITLDDLPSDSSLYKILPAYKYQKEGEQIIYASDIVYIVRASSFMNKLTYLHASEEMKDYGKTSDKIKPLKLQIGKKDIIKREVNAALDEENQTQWRISIYSDYIAETSEFLRCGDVIWLHHSETNSTIAACRKSKPADYKTNPDFHLTRWLSLENVHLKVIEGSSKESYDEYTGDTHSMWIIESEIYKEGGYVQFENTYRFKHLSSGLYLSAGNEETEFKFKLEKQRTPETLFYFSQLKNVQSRDKIIEKGSYVYICHQSQLQKEQKENDDNFHWVDIFQGQEHKKERLRLFPKLHQELHKTDQSVFKLYVSSSNDVWEIQFVLSCIKTLMNYLTDMRKLEWKDQQSDKEKLKDFLQKIQTTKLCIEDINSFCNNQLYNSTPEQKYGTINPFRQKLLKDHNYIDLLVKILEDTMKQQEFDIWNNKSFILSKPDQSVDVSQKSQKDINIPSKKQGLKEVEKLGFVAFKIQLFISIYRLVTSICKNNPENETYTFDLIPGFLGHCKYIPQAITCLISIIGNNQQLLNKLSGNIQIDFNYKDAEFFEPEEEKMQLQQQDQVNSNFFMFFINMLENDEALHKSQFLTFLRSMCIFNGQGINQNQELIFKLIKKYNKKKLSIVKEREDLDKLSVKDGRLIIPLNAQSEVEEMKFINEQLQFFADVSYGRNYLWRWELENYFTSDFLFSNIWDKQNKTYHNLQASLCKIAMSLYIDHYPLNRQQLPQYCHLYKSIDQPIINNTIHDQYKILISDLFTYLRSNKDNLHRIMMIDTKTKHTEQQDYQQLEQSDDISNVNLLHNELLYNSIQMLTLLLELNVFNMIDQDPSTTYKDIIDILVRMFFYDFKHLHSVQELYQIQNKEIQERKTRRDNKKTLGGLNLNLNINIPIPNPMGFLTGNNDEKKDDESEEEENQGAQIDDIQMYTNPMMRGLIRLENQLNVNNEDKSVNMDIKIKLELCDIMDRFLDMRQNYLMENILAFFKLHIVEKEFVERKEDVEMKVQMLAEGKNDDDIRQQQLIRHIERKLIVHIKGLLPNIGKTGIKDIDEIEKKEDTFQMIQSFGNIMKNKMMSDGESEKEDFTIYTVKLLQIQDIDTYFSQSFNDNDPKNPIACLLPYLLTSFGMIRDEKLEKRSLSIVMRLFNQREELCHNISKLQLIADPVKSKLFEYLQKDVIRLNMLIDKSEVWMTDFIKSGKPQELDETIEIIKNFRLGFFTDTQISNEIHSKGQEIDPEKQNLMYALQIQKPILNLVRDQMQNFVFNLQKLHNLAEKQKISLLFMYSFQFLNNFCKGNHQNQLLLHNHLNDILQFLEVEVGQIPLICEIYRDNQKLLKNINQKFLDIFVRLIQNAGRKEQFLDPFLVFIIQGNKYIFDNQLLVLNTFLTSKVLLFSHHDYQFIFDGNIQMLQSDFLSDLAQQQSKDQPYRYHSKLLELLLQCTFIKSDYQNDKDEQLKDNFTINVAKLKKTYKTQYIVSLLKEEDAFTEINPSPQQKGLSQLKKSLCQFFRFVHITSEKSYVIQREITQSMTDIIEFEIGRLDNLSPDINYFKFVDYLGDAILPLFTNYYERKNFTIQNEDEEEQHEQEQKDLSLLSSYARRLSHQIKLFYGSFKRKNHVQGLNEFIKNFPQTNLCKLLNDQTEDQENTIMRSHLLNILSGYEENLQVDVFDNKLQNLNAQTPQDESHLGSNLGSHQDIPKTIFNEIKFSKTKKIVSLMKNSHNKQKHDEEEDKLIEVSDDKVELIDLQWDEFCYQFSKGAKSQELVELEIDQLAQAIIKFEQLYSKEQKSEFKMLIKKLINFLQYSLNSQEDNKTIITLLCVLRKVITPKKVEGEQLPEQIQEAADKLAEIKSLFNKLGASRMVLTVISESQQLDNQLFGYLLLFINQLLSGGNNRVQKTIYEFFKTYPKSEVIFQRLSQVITQQIQLITSHNKDAQIDYQDENIVKQQKEQEQTMIQVLYFLQSCCKGHYLELQNYLRQQTNSRNSYNMINLVADLLKTYYQDKKVYSNMVICIDTLNELVQGPCLENQIAVSESKFLEITQDLFITKKDKDQTRAQTMQTNIKQSTGKLSQLRTSRFQSHMQNDLFKWQVERIQTKCLILVLSLIEMRDLSDPIIKIIMRNLPIELLQKHMNKVFAKYSEQCKEGYQIEVLDRLKENPESKPAEDEQPKKPEYFELILQKGFFLYFLMCNYMESEKTMDNQFAQMFRQYTRSKFSQEKGSLESLLFGDNIIGQLFKFVMQLAESSLSLVNEMKKKGLQLVQNQLSPEDLEKLKQLKIQEKKRLIKRSFQFFAQNSGCIEVIRNNEIEVIYFILLPQTHNLPKETKNEFHELVDRSSTKSKVQYLFQEADRIIEICQHEEDLRRIFQRQKFLALFANYVKLWKDLAYMFTLLLNLFIIGSFAEQAGHPDSRLNGYQLFQKSEYTVEQTKSIFLICGTIMACCSIFVVSFFLFKNAPIIIKKAWKTKLPLEDEIKYWVFQLFVKLIKIVVLVLYILKEIEVVYYLAYGALAVIGTVVHPFFFSFHLTEILIRYPTLKNVVRSVWEPKAQLGLTFILFIIIIYVYSLVAYTFFSEDYQGRCSTTLFCFLFTFDFTFKANGGVGGQLTSYQDDGVTTKFNWGRVLFDNSYNLLLVIIMLNIVAGIIIDTFGSLREQESDKQSDIEDKCFICGNLKTLFDRQTDSPGGGGFAYHIKINHYMWNYVFFQAYLQYKDHEELTGIEKYVSDKMKIKDLSWIPFNRARELQTNSKQDDEEDTSKVEKISQDVFYYFYQIFFLFSDVSDNGIDEVSQLNIKLNKIEKESQTQNLID